MSPGSDVIVHMSRINSKKRACLHKGGGPQVGEVIRIGGVTCLSI